MPPFKAKLYDPRRDTSPTSEDNLKACLAFAVFACLLARSRHGMQVLCLPGAHYVDQANLLLKEFSHFCLLSTKI